MENIISKALKDNELSHDYFTTIINGERNYRELKKSIRMMKNQKTKIKDGIGNWN